MACRNCFDNCAGEPISDKCIRTSLNDIPLLGICKGDTLSLVESIFASKILSALDGTGILPADVTIDNYEDLKDALKYKAPTLNNLLQILIDNQQSLSEAIEGITGTSPLVFDTKCLEGLTEDPTRDEILQAAINMLCTQENVISTLDATYVKQTDLTTLVNNIISGAINEDDDEEAPVSSQQYLKMVPKVAYEYYGDLSNFDSQGKGLSGQGFDKVYLCNGLNGTPDKRGRTAIGAVRNVPGATLDSAVDPNNPSNPNSNYAVGDKVGKGTHTLVVGEMPSHSHVVNDPGHTHNIATNKNDVGISYQPNGLYDGTDNNSSPVTLTTKPGFSNVSVQASGSGSAHNNMQPSIAALFIMYIP